MEVTVDRIGPRGDGIADSDVGPIYVPLTVPGDRVRVKPVAPRGNGLSAALLELIAPGPSRTEPPCPHYGQCGGCALQHLTDDAYAHWKQQRLTNALARAGITGYRLEPLVRTPPGARRRAIFAACRPGGDDREAIVGFTVRRGHQIAQAAACAVVDPRIRSLLPHLPALLGAVLKPRQRAAVIITVLQGGVDVVVDAPDEARLAERERLSAFARSADVARVSWRHGPQGAVEPVFQRGPVGATFGEVFVSLPPGCFLQPSAHGEAALVAAVQAFAGSAVVVADLFAGAGTFTFPLAAAGARVHAIDADEPSLQALAAAARTPAPGAARVTWERRDLERRPLSAAELGRYDTVVLDPPRAGARSQCEALARSTVEVVVAASCNPDTFARDCRILMDGGYRLEQVTPIDQFLWSSHLEIVGRLRRGGAGPPQSGR